MLNSIQKVHFIGIGGAGMSALAHVLCKRGFCVTGSDANPGHTCKKLAEIGAVIYQGHDAAQIDGAQAIVVSTAIREDNCELAAAKERGLKILHRSDVLAYLLNNAEGVAVAGAHGKTTTSAMLGCITVASGIDPTVVIGGEVAGIGGNAVNGNGKILVAEADESDGSFLKLLPSYAIVTNIEDDHLDHYGSEENIYAAFKDFLSNIRPGGVAVLCIDNDKLAQLSKEVNCDVISYGTAGSGADYEAHNVRYSMYGTEYDVYFKGEYFVKVELIVPGKHNVLNSLGALATAKAIGIETDVILAALKEFSGAKRRFETKGRVDGVWVVDDYAHHPTEIEVTLKAARQTEPARLLCVFQPHRYTRTKFLFEEFCGCFGDSDKVIITDIYSAGELPLKGINGKALADGIKAKTNADVEYISDMSEIEKILLANAKAGDLIMTIGAGDVYKIGEALVEDLKRS